MEINLTKQKRYVADAMRSSTTSISRYGVVSGPYEKSHAAGQTDVTSRNNSDWVKVASARRRGNMTPQQSELMGKRDMGSAFTLERMTRKPLQADVTITGYDIYYQDRVRSIYKGPNMIDREIGGIREIALTGYSWPSVLAEEAALLAKGATAIANTLPNKSTMDLAVSLSELVREGLPSRLGAQIAKGGLNTRTLGGEYLNYQFGVAPLMSDIKSLIDVVLRSSELLREYHDRSSEHIRRAYDFGTETETSEFTYMSGAYGQSAIWDSLETRSGVRYSRPQVTRKVTRRTWFSGAYSYYLPYGDDLLSKIRLWEAEANHLLGIRITPEVLWNLTPWSWLSDWFVNIGDILTNASYIGRDGLVLHYGYIMQETKLHAEISLPGVASKDGVAQGCKEDFYLTRKLRRAASPYGFGLTGQALSAKQWSILAALGATRAPGIGFIRS